jgi:hypothetical protein
MRTAALGVLLVTSASSANCTRALRLCTCVRDGETFAQSISEFAAGTRGDSAQRLGAYLDVIFRSETEEVAPDSVGLGTRRRFDPRATRPVFRFAVNRAWTARGPRTRRRNITLYGPSFRFTCPEPHWEAGRRYILFVYPEGDTLRYYAVCEREHSLDSLDTRAGVRVLDSLLRRY